MPSWGATVVASFLSGSVITFVLGKLWEIGAARRKRSSDLRTAALLVSDELRANIVRLEVALEGAPEATDDLQSQTYQEFQAILARYLDRESRDLVRGAYVFARVPRVLHRLEGVTASHQLSVKPIRSHIEEALRRAHEARSALAKHAGHAAEI